MTRTADQMKRAVHEIRRLRLELEEATRDRTESEAVAIIGAGMRLPGGIHSLSTLEKALTDGQNLVTGIPPERWTTSDVPGDLSSAAGYGAFIDNADQFSPEFFGISGAEAASMDPQQRLILEVGWEALEDAGQAPDKLFETSLGVFLGIANSDYGRMVMTDMAAIDPYFTSGSAFSVAAGRLSYFLGAKGPAVSVDTACSSSLVALHMARQSLIAGESDVALAGGVNLMLSPEVHVNFVRAGMLALDGRCKTFDASADGYVRGEGCALLTLKRLDDALDDGDRILGIIRGSAINQDGRSNGLTAPNGPSQEDLIRSALDDAGISASDVGYVEAHGTGTSLGDPIEMNAISRAYERDQEGALPLVVGSVKTNFGHLESAAGAAGVLKTLIALRSGQIPAHLNFSEPNPHIDWNSVSVRIPAASEAWPIDGPRVAGVSSFGFSGTNAHLILGEPPEATAPDRTADLPWHLFTMSAKSSTALRTLSGKTSEAIASSGDVVSDICHTANAGRAQLSHRLAVAVKDSDDLTTLLGDFASGQLSPGCSIGVAQPGRKPKVAFLFTGQGAQHPGMGRVLYETQPVYRSAIDACAKLIGDKVPGGLVAALHETDDRSRIRDPNIAQPALFALEYALARLWMSLGIRPDAVCGHSLGEFVAAVVAGVMPLEGALALVAERGRLTAQVAADGMMASVFAPQEVIGPIIADCDEVGIAAYNTPRNHVLSGSKSVLQPVLDKLSAKGIRVEPLQIAFAAHCPLVDPILDEFRAAADQLTYSSPRIPLVSNLDGGFASAGISSPKHWVDHLRQPVRFGDGVSTMLEAGITHFIEVGPHPVLSTLASECVELGESTAEPVFLTSLHRDDDAGRELVESLGRLFVDGVPVNTDGLQAKGTARLVDLPTYPFERARHWHPSARPNGGNRSAIAPEARWTRLESRLARAAERGPLGFDAQSCADGWKALAALTRATVISLLKESNIFSEPDSQVTTADVVAKMGALSDFEPLISRWLNELVTTGDLVSDNGVFRSPRPLDEPDLEIALSRAEAALAGNVPLMNYVHHCVELVGPVIRGTASPLDTLFPEGDFSLALGLYEQSSTMRYMNGLAAAAVDAIASSAGSKLRVIEAGAGTGGTTAAVLEALTGQPMQYVFTDVSDLFLDRARDRFGDRSDLSFALFDLEVSPEDQNIPVGGFDIVLASNAVHAVRDLPATLEHLRSLLRPGGMLVMIESTQHFEWFNVTTGLIEGWRHAEDSLRQDDLALIDAETWLTALGDAGFERAGAWPGSGTPADVVGQHVIVAQAPAEASMSHAGGFASIEEEDPVVTQTIDPAIAASLEEIADALPKERTRAIAGLVRIRVMGLLRRNPDQPPQDHERLLDLGLDSLMAVQLRNALARDLAVPSGLPATLVFDHPTIAALSVYLGSLSAEQSQDVETPEPQAASSIPSDRVSDIEAMSEEEVEALLLARLNR